jgi:hypothetical protein
MDQQPGSDQTRDNLWSWLEDDAVRAVVNGTVQEADKPKQVGLPLTPAVIAAYAALRNPR